MPKALISAITAAILATWMASAAAYSDSADQPPPPSRAIAAKASAAKSTHMKLQPGGADNVKVRAVYSPDIRPNPPQAFAADDGPEAGESGWRSYGMLLATLVLMAVIAVRRFKVGRH